MSKFFLRNKTVILIGGSGNLGRSMVKKFRAGSFMWQWNVFNIDVEENKQAQANFILDPSRPMKASEIESLHEQLHAFDEEYDAIMNLAGLFYPPNNMNFLRMLKKKGQTQQDGKLHHPFSISSPDCFENYQKIQQAELATTTLAVHLADQHLSPNGFFMVCGSKAALLGQQEAAPLEHVAKSAVMQASVNLSLNKIKEDIVYENTCMTVFLPNRLDQDRNADYLKKSKHDKSYKAGLVNNDEIVNLLKLYAHGEQRPSNGIYFDFYKVGKRNPYVMPRFYN